MRKSTRGSPSASHSGIDIAEQASAGSFIHRGGILGDRLHHESSPMPVVPVGAAPSALTLDQSGALFQLWTIEQTAAKDYLLDQKIVSTYLPTATVSVTTLDPYPRAVRTRVDKPFTVTLNIQGLVTVKNNQKEQSSVLLKRFLGNYPTDHPLLDPAVILTGTPYSSGYVSTNGNTVLNFPASALRAANPTKASGEEHFTVSILAASCSAIR